MQEADLGFTVIKLVAINHVSVNLQLVVMVSKANNSVSYSSVLFVSKHLLSLGLNAKCTSHHTYPSIHPFTKSYNKR